MFCRVVLGTPSQVLAGITPGLVVAMSTAAEASIVAAANAGVTELLAHASAVTNASGKPWLLKHTEPRLRLVVHDSPHAGRSQRAFKAVIELPFSLTAVVTHILDLEARMKWDKNIAKLAATPVREVLAAQPLPQDTASYLVFCSCTRAVGPISGRDFVDAIYVGPMSLLPDEVRLAAPPTVAATAWVNGGAGLPGGHASFPESSSFVRGANFGSGWVVELLAGPSDASATAAPLPRGATHGGWTRVTYIVQSDLKGWLPAAVVNASMVNMFVTFFDNLIAHMAAAAAAVPK